MGTVVFDLDGTLADTSGDLIAATNAALAVLGHGPQLDAGRDAATAVRGARAMLRLAADRLGHEAPETLIEAGFPILLEAYSEAIDVHTRLYPGASGCIAALVDAGYRVAVCTNKPEGLARTLLERLSGRIRLRCASRTRHPIARPWSVPEGIRRKACLSAIPSPTGPRRPRRVFRACW